MFQRFGELACLMWGDKITLATTAHFLGGLGVGLLVSRSTARRLKALAYAGVGFALLAHLYALLSMPSVPAETREPAAPTG
ncbi:MAG TPA: hypothetical protein VFZ25_01010 [Chloroflexota bacterium]|nr:hypothetical protein [Chloroflexota bacterium]